MTHSETVIAFDFGIKNIGVAVGESSLQTASELKPIKANEGQPNWDTMAALFQEWKPSKIVVGLPLNMDGSDSELTRRARKFGNKIKGRFGQNIEFADERLSSVEAKNEAKAQGHKGDYGRNPIDSKAARIILEAWWNSQI